MNNMIVVVAIVAIAIFFVFAGTKLSGGEKNPFKYKRRVFMTANEEAFFKHFVAIFPDKFIAPQVSMDAVIEPDVDQGVKNKEGKSAYQSMRGTIKANKIDFLILDSKFKPEFIIELDDNTHNDKGEADAKRDQNLMQAGIPTIRIRRNKQGFPNRAYFDKALGK